MSLRDVRSQGLGRITAIIAAMMIALATMFAFTSMPQQALAADDSQTNFDSWTEVAANIEKQLETAEQDYNDGNYYQAGTDFQNAHWVGYDASNFSKVVNDTIGADKQKGIVFENMKLKVVTVGEDGYTLDDVLTHDAHQRDTTLHSMLAAMKYPDYPVALGVIRAVEDATVYDREVARQVEEVKAQSKIHSVDELLHSGATWEIE